MKNVTDKIKEKSKENLRKYAVPEDMINEVLKQMDIGIKNPDFKNPTWEGFLPNYFVEIWFELSEDAKLVAYIMACVLLREQAVKNKIPDIGVIHASTQIH